MLLFENTFLHTFEAGSEFAESIATEKEEVMYGSLLLYDEQEAIRRGEQASKLNYKEKKELESRILRKKQVYERYIGYLVGEIDPSHIAPIRLYWIDNIIALTSSFT